MRIAFNKVYTTFKKEKRHSSAAELGCSSVVEHLPRSLKAGVQLPKTKQTMTFSLWQFATAATGH
jgi:hypothetical protein